MSDESDDNTEIVDDIESIDDNERFKDIGFHMQKGITVYNSVNVNTEQSVLDSIEFYKENGTSILSPLTPSTLTAEGVLSNIQVNEEEIIKKFKISKNPKIVRIGCNYGEILYYPNPFMKYHITTIIKYIKMSQKHLIIMKCFCRNLLENPNKKSKLIQYITFIEENTPEMKDIIDNVIKKKLYENNYSKINLTKIIRDFKNIIIFNNISLDRLKNLYIVIEEYIQDKQIQNLCIKMLNYIETLFKYISKYENGCTCYKNQLSNKQLDNPNTLALLKDKIEINKDKKSNRGRKIKVKKQSKRVIKGSGKHFNSQFSFYIVNTNYKKLYNIKIFRNGTFHVTGVLEPSMIDLIDSMHLITEYLSEYLLSKGNEPIKVEYIFSVMRNYKCSLINKNLTILLNQLESIMHSEMENSVIKSREEIKAFNDILNSKFPDKKVKQKILHYTNFSNIKITEIRRNVERSPGLILCIEMPPSLKRKEKGTTIKILSSGKINFGGGHSEINVAELYYWIQYIFNKYKIEVIYDPDNFNMINSSDSEEYYSLYDDDEEKMREFGYL